MAVEFQTLKEALEAPFDEIIDVRSPSEYAEDHVPGAVNLPALNDEERALVGTIYVQESKFRARKIGAGLVSVNIAHHLQTHLADKPGAYKPLIYCWRGGQRSGSMATVLTQVGWQVETLAGGYRSYRRLVVDATHNQSFPTPVIVLEGNTGTAKTEILNRAGDFGVQVIDLEGLANHRGSLFGRQLTDQPSQKSFEGHLGAEMMRLDPTRPVIVESESNKIGARSVPPSLWKAMGSAPRIRVTVPLAARARYLTTAYRDIVANKELLAQVINQLRPYHAGDVVDGWLALADQGAFETLATELMAVHYDPRYEKHRARMNRAEALTLDLPDLSVGMIDEAARRLAEHVAELEGRTGHLQSVS